MGRRLWEGGPAIKEQDDYAYGEAKQREPRGGGRAAQRPRIRSEEQLDPEPATAIPDEIDRPDVAFAQRSSRKP